MAASVSRADGASASDRFGRYARCGLRLCGCLLQEGARNDTQVFLGTNYKEIPVAAKCDVCAKGPGFGHNVPWSKKKTNRRWNPNIQRVRATVNGVAQRVNVCTSCLKAGKVAR